MCCVLVYRTMLLWFASDVTGEGVWSQLGLIDGHCIVETMWQRGWQDRMAGLWQRMAVLCSLLYIPRSF